MIKLLELLTEAKESFETFLSNKNLLFCPSCFIPKSNAIKLPFLFLANWPLCISFQGILDSMTICFIKFSTS